MPSDPASSASDAAARQRLAQLAPSTPLTVAEAAELAGVSQAALEHRLATGELRYETAKRRGRDVRLVRVVDLREAFAPEAEPAPEAAPAAEPARPSAPASAPARAPDPGPDSALVPLLGELRVRVEEAERERRASTAGLLLAQRRLLELESAARPVPWHRRSGVWTGFCATCALGALWLDLSGRLAEVRSAAQGGQSALAGTAARLDAEVGGLGAQLTALAAASGRAREDAEAARRLAESRAAEEATARRAERERMESEREALTARLDELRRDAEVARATLVVERDAGARERERFAQRLDSAERELERARGTLAQERDAASEDRAAFLARLAALDLAERQRAASASATLGELEREVLGVRAATQRAEEAAQRLETAARTPEAPREGATASLALSPSQRARAKEACFVALRSLFGLRPAARLSSARASDG